MTGMVQPDLGPPATKYKEDSIDDPLRHGNSGRSGSQQPQSRSNLAQPQKQGPASPVQPSRSLPPTTYPPPPHQLGNEVLHHNHYGPPPQSRPTTPPILPIHRPRRRHITLLVGHLTSWPLPLKCRDLIPLSTTPLNQAHQPR